MRTVMIQYEFDFERFEQCAIGLSLNDEYNPVT